jgi:hypothetical protein
MTRIRRLLLRTISILTMTVSAGITSPVPIVQGQPEATTRLRIGVTSDGLTVVRPQDLAAAGVDPAGVNPQTFALSSMGQPIAMRVVGEGDGRFDGSDFLLFYGERFRGSEMEEKYTDERVYWLDIGGVMGPRVPDVVATPQGNLTPPADFPETAHAEESKEHWTLETLNLDTEDTWFWARLNAGASANLGLSVPDPAPGNPSVLRVEVVARSFNNAISPDHRTTVALNGASLLDEFWDGKTRHVFQAVVSGGLVIAGQNTVAVRALGTPNWPVDEVYVNYVELDYRRLFRAFDGVLGFPAETLGWHEYLASGWPSAQVEIWDVTTPAAPRRLTGASAQSSGGNVTVRFRVEDGPNSRYWLQAAELLKPPASIRLRPVTVLRMPPGGADAVIVTDESLLPAAQTLASWHVSRGRRAVVVQFRDVVDEFNEGIYHPKAVPAMLAWAQTHWTGSPPGYLTLLGDGHWNFKGFNPAKYPPAPNLLPPYLAWVDPWQGEAPADALYGDWDGDGMAELAVGRIPANSLAEANTVVGKIIAYDETERLASWQRRSLFVADNNDTDGRYAELSDEIILGYLPSDQTAQRVYLNTPATPDAGVARTAIQTAIQNGVFMVQYMGHGTIDSWAQEQMWRRMDVAGLNNGAALPVVMTFNCWDGYFAYPGQSSMAEAMLLRQGGGSVAAISPTGLGITPDEQNFRKLLMTALFRDDVRELGLALRSAKEQFHNRYGENYLLTTMTLYGDPAMRLPQEKVWGNWAYLPYVLR